MLALASVVFFLPDAFSRWFLPKELLALLAGLLASRTVPAGRIPRGLWIILGVAGALLVVSAALGAAPFSQILGRWPRHEGVIALPVYVLAAWMGARLLGPDAPGTRRGIFTVSVAAVALLLGVVTLLETAGLAPIPTDLSRPGALLGNASDQGIVAAVLAALLALPLYRACVALNARLRPAERPSAGALALLLAAFVASVLTVVLSGSRAGLLALSVAFAFIAITLITGAFRSGGVRASRTPLIATGGALFVVVLAVLAVPAMRDRLVGLTGYAQRTIEDRLLIWGDSIALLAQRPLTGVGPSGFADAIAVNHSAAWYAHVDQGTVLDSPHNWVLQAAMAGGVPLMLVALVFCGYLCIAYLRARKTEAGGTLQSGTLEMQRGDLLLAAFAALLGLAAALLTHFTTAATGILGGLLVGVVVAATPRVEKKLVFQLRSALIAVWLVLFAVLVSAEFPMQRALSAVNGAEASAEFDAAAALRPWDPELALVAAQALTGRADAGDQTALEPALRWSERAFTLASASTSARTVLAVAQRVNGQYDAAAQGLADLAAELPYDSDIAMQNGIALAMTGDLRSARNELERAAELRPGDPTIESLLKQLP